MAVTGNKITVGEYLNVDHRRIIVKALLALPDTRLRGVKREECEVMHGQLLEWFTKATNVHVRHELESRKPA